MSTIQVRNINFEPTGNNRITYESSNGYFAIVLGGNRVLDAQSGNVRFSTSSLTLNTVSSNTVTSNLIGNVTGNLIGNVTGNVSGSSVTSNTVVANTGNISNLSISSSLTIAGSRGNTGQVLTSQGSNSAPTWSTISSGPIGNDLRIWTKTLDLSTSGGSGTSNRVIDLDSDRQIFLTSGSSVHAFIYQKSTDSFGTPVLVRAANTTSCFVVGALINSNSVLVCSLENNTTGLQTVVLSTSGTTITVNTPVSTTLAQQSYFQVDGSTQSPPSNLIPIGSAWILEYFDISAVTPYLRAITVSGTTPTVGAQLSMPGSSPVYGGPSFAVSSNTAVFVRMTGAGIQVTPVILSGTTLTAGTSNVMSGYSASTSTLLTLAGRLLSSDRVGFITQRSSGGNSQAFIVTVSGTNALMSNVDLGFSYSQYPAIQVVGNNKMLIVTNNGVNVVTDNSGIPVAGTRIQFSNLLPFGYSANTILAQPGGEDQTGHYVEIGVSGNDPVILYGTKSGASGTRVSNMTFSQFLNGNSRLGKTLRTSSGKHIGTESAGSEFFAPVVTSGSNSEVTFAWARPDDYQSTRWTRANSESELFIVGSTAITGVLSNRIFITKLEAI